MRVMLGSPMNLMRPILLVLWAICGVPAFSQTAGVIGTVHNLSVSGPGEVKSLTETEICKFCHIPHNSVAPTPLWAQTLSRAQYETPQIRLGTTARVAAPQPDGSSRLCLSCHDGTVALGEIGNRPRLSRTASQIRLRPGQAGYLGTDLSGSHPISFVVTDTAFRQADAADVDMGLKDLELIRADPAVNLDSAGKMQCTTCHDPHVDSYYDQGRVPRFWVRPSVQEVCLTCHDPR